MNKRTKVMLVTFLGTLIVAILSLNATYSYMKNKTSGDKDTDVKVNSCAKITLEENSNTINLTNMYPMDDEMGLQTEAYEFTVSSTCDNYVGFDLYLTTYASDIADGTIKYAITSKNDTVLASNLLTSMPEGLEGFTDAEKAQLKSGVTEGYKKIYKVFTNNIPLKGESEYKLHIWIDNSNDVDTTMGKSFSLGVSVKSFDRDESMAEYLIRNKDNTLIYHDGTPDYEGMANYDQEAEDLSYRYTGASEEVNNYVCFGSESCAGTDELYRIIGLFKNDLNLYEMKIIKATRAIPSQLGTNGALAKVNRYHWNYSDTEVYDGIGTNDWANSNLNNNNLNGFYLNEYLYPIDNHKWYNMIENHVWITAGNNLDSIFKQKVKNAYINEIQNPNIGNELPSAAATYKAKIGLMYVSDYGYAAYSDAWATKMLYDYKDSTVINNNWLYMGTSEWSITRASNFVGNVLIVHQDAAIQVDGVGDNDDETRPVMYLKTDVKKATNSGNGTAESPYIITQ